MLTLTLRSDRQTLVRVTIEFMDKIDEHTARYSVRVAADRGDAIGFHQRVVEYNYEKWNPMALAKLALDSLDMESFEAEDGSPGPPDMAREERRTLREIQGR